jgi:hypothetical protein
MLVAAHQPLFIPWIGYFDKINKVDLFVIVDNVQFTSEGWMRRNVIRGKNNLVSLVVPLYKMKSHWDSKINEIMIDEKDFRWKRVHLNSLQMNYGRTPYFSQIYPVIKEIYSQQFYHLCSLNIELIKAVCNYLEIRTPLIQSSQLNAVGKKTDLIIDICKKTNANSFMLGMGGSRDYAKRVLIESNGIKILEQDFQHPVYNQICGEFTPNLSILDLLFNCGPASKEILASSGT